VPPCSSTTSKQRPDRCGPTGQDTLTARKSVSLMTRSCTVEKRGPARGSCKQPRAIGSGNRGEAKNLRLQSLFPHPCLRRGEQGRRTDRRGSQRLSDGQEAADGCNGRIHIPRREPQQSHARAQSAMLRDIASVSALSVTGVFAGNEIPLLRCFHASITASNAVRSQPRVVSGFELAGLRKPGHAGRSRVVAP